MWANRFFGIQYPSYFPEEGLDVDLEDADKDIDQDTNADEDEDTNTGDEDTDEDKDKKDEEEVPLSRFTLEDLKVAFKDKPELLKEAKHAFFREQKFTELFPTIEDAKKAAEAQTAYEELASAVIEGDADRFIEELKNEGDGLKNFASNFLPSLLEADKDLYLDIAQPVVQQFVRNAYAYGVREKDTNVANAAKIIHKVLFGGSYDDIERDTPLINRDRAPKKENKEDKDKQDFFARKYNELRNEVSTICYSQLDAEINKGLEDLTKTKPGLKKLIAKDVKDRILDAMDRDPNYMARIQGLWKREQRMGFSGSLKQSFATTFMGKAKTLIPKFRAEARKEALGKEDITEEKDIKRIPGGKQSSNSSNRMTAERAKKENLSTRQIFE